LAGLFSGLGAACADGIYGVIAGFGVTYITNFMLSRLIWLRIFGGVYIGYLGIRSYTSKIEISSVPYQAKGLMANYLSTFLLTLTNPMTILSFAAVFAGFGATGEAKVLPGPYLLVLGVITGSAFWWLLLSQIIGSFRRYISPEGFRWINRFSGLVLLSFSILVIASQFFKDSPL
jgi:threonine/homoserine/homoserine lactone efflux protein